MAVLGGAHDGRDLGQARHLMRPPAALTNDQLIAGVRLAHHNGLKQPDFLDRFGQLGQ